METFTFTRGDEHPGLTLPWTTETAQNVFTDLDLSGGTYTFALSLIASDGTENVMSATVTGADGSVSIVWAVDDLDLTPGVYQVKLIGTEIATSKQRSYSPGRPVRIHIT